MKFALGLFILAVMLFTISNHSAIASHDSQSTASAVESANELDTPPSDLEPMAYPEGLDRLSEEIDDVVYGLAR